ncbi:MAG: hypothetical protein WEA24_10640 [Gemmatimonadota bacterium]
MQAAAILSRSGLLAAVFCTVLPAAAQDSVRVAPGRACPACRVTLTPTLVLGADAGVYGPTVESRVARDSRGRFYVAPTYTPGTIAVFASAGRFQRAFGTEGGGPEEFRGIQNVVVGPGDTLWVVGGGGRITVVDPEHRIIRSVTADGGARGILPSGDGSVIAMSMSGAGGVILDAAGEEVGRLALSDPGQSAMSGQAAVVRLGDGRLVALHGTRYRLDVLDATGVRQRTVDRSGLLVPRARE